MLFTRNDAGELYDFTKNIQALRWKDIFAPSLKKILEQVHPLLTAEEDAFSYVETLCLRVLAKICGKPFPHCTQEIEEKVKKIFPAPINYWALNEANEIINNKKRKLTIPLDSIHSLLQKDVLQYKLDISVTTFIVAVVEYLSADILKLSGNYVRKIKHSEITKEDIEIAICADKVLMDIFYQNELSNVALASSLPTFPKQYSCSTYQEVVNDLIHEEKQYQRELNMIIHVFRKELAEIVRDRRDLDKIFSNIFDIYDVTQTLLGSLEDVVEMAQEERIPCVGSCFEELAEAEEFHVYNKYAQDVTSLASRETLSSLLSQPDAVSLLSAGHGFRNAVKYYLPKLLLVPIWHAFLYLDYVKVLMELSPVEEDIESLKQVQGLLRPLLCDLENIVSILPKELQIPLNNRIRRQLAIEKTKELQSTAEHWDKDLGQNCNEFIREDNLGKLGSGKRLTERKVYLFDELLVLCKPNLRKSAVALGTSTFDFKLKEKYFIRQADIVDRDDTEELKNCFEISPPAVILIAKSLQHKNDWMADLIMISTKSMLDRILDSILLDEERKHPLRMPSVDIYRFAIPDSPENIVFEEKKDIGIPLIKGATLLKLIERLTYHIYADPMFVRTFLITYRYFCSPQNLLRLLIERFNIPEPNLVYQDNDIEKCLKNSGFEKACKYSQRDDWKRYRKEYVQPVQFRVLNVLRHWVDHHFYDFEKEPFLRETLLRFLENISGKSMRKWVDSVLKIVERKSQQDICHRFIACACGNNSSLKEPIDSVIDLNTNLLILHPLELAQQLTLLEFDLYKNVKPSELVGSPWTKKDKELESPNLLKIMKHTTNVTRWIEKSIIESENYEERIAVVTRAIEVMMAMLELNNFNGILSICAAMGSASVYRLKLTFQGLPARYEKFLEECRELNDGHLKKYQEKLRSINPPCVPFFGQYLTNILHLEEGNPDFLPNTNLINFSKRRKVSEIIGEIQQYQSQPYNLLVDEKIRSFLENLNPFNGMSDTDISNFLYKESLRIEPRGCKQAPKFPRKWTSVSLKSTGIKHRRLINSRGNSGTCLQNTISLNSKSLNHMPSNMDWNPTALCSSISTCTLFPSNQMYSIFANINIPQRSEITWNSCVTVENVAPDGSSVFLKPRDFNMDSVDLFTPLVLNHENVSFLESSDIKMSIRAIPTAFNEKHSIRQSRRNLVEGVEDNASPWSEDQMWLPLRDQGALTVDTLLSSTRERRSSDKIDLHLHQDKIVNSICNIKSLHCSTETISGRNFYEEEIVFPRTGIRISNNVAQHTPTVDLSSEGTKHRSSPPPLPPRRREQTERFGSIAQNCGIPVPVIPPRDAVSAPPIPPKLNFSLSESLGGHQNKFVDHDSFQIADTCLSMEKYDTGEDILQCSLRSLSTIDLKISSSESDKSIPTENLAMSTVLSSSSPIQRTFTSCNQTVTSISQNIPVRHATSDSLLLKTSYIRRHQLQNNLNNQRRSFPM